MKKTLQKSSLLIIGMLISLFAFAQTRSITFQTIPTGAYGQSSSIAVLFTPAGVFPVNNTRFNLYLSDPDGNFNSTASNTAIGTAQTHYITFINGQIPANASAANTYKLKITAFDGSGGVLATATSSFTINIQNTTGTNGDGTTQKFTIPADVSPVVDYTINNGLNLYGRCVASTDDVYLVNKTSNSVTISVKNEFDGTSIATYNNDPFATQNQNVTLTSLNQKIKLTGSPQKVHYRFFQTITDAAQSNTISTKAFFFMNNELAAPFSALLSVVCYDIGTPGIFTFKTDIDPTRVGSAFFNYPGNIYTAKWDDNSANYITSIQDIVDKGGLLTHPYSESSCGKTVTASNGTFHNSFGPSMTVAEPSNCTQTQEALTPIQIFPKPKISYTGPTKGCLGSELTFTNTSIISPQGSKFNAGCTTPDIIFYWFIDGSSTPSAISKDFTTSSLSIGNHTIQLVAASNGTTLSCSAAPYETVVCIEAAPPSDAARFALIDTDNNRNADTTICPANSPFLVVNKSSTLTSGSYCSTLNYNWKLTGPAGFTEVNTTVSSTSPNFTVPSLTIKGDYTLTLTVSNPCGTSNTFTRKITVLERPAITTQPTSQTVCDGDNTTFTAAATGSNITYKWQVKIPSGTYTDVTNTGVYTGATTASLTITGATVSMNGYKYQLIVSGTCTPAGTSSEVTLTVNPRPTSVITGSTTVCANSPATISIALTGTAPWNITYSDGTTSTSVSTSSSTYTFSVSLATTKTYSVTSLTDANCTAVAGDRTGSAIITVNPLPTISGTLNACVGSTTQLSGSATADATTPWSSASTGVATISNTGLVTGVSAGTSVITYTNSNGCIITATVTINPLPTVSIPNTNQSLCKSNGSPSGSVITPTTTTTISTYRWFSNTTASNTGGTEVATTSTFTPPNTNAGELFYYLTVTNNNGCVATSNVSGSIKVYGQPTISSLPTTTSYCINAPAATLTPTITNGGYGTLNYQWYSNTTASTSGATLIANETNATFTPPTTAAGVRYYYVVVTNGGPISSSECNTATSNFAEVKVYGTPTIPTDPVSATYCAGATPVALTVPNATNGGYGSTTYQWYSNTTASTTGGTLIGSAATFTPNISSEGTTYYYVNINNGGTGGAVSCNNLNSAIATITVHPLPVITSGTFATESLCISSTATSMTASATTTTGTIASYQWYSNANANNTGGTIITGATNATFTPPTNATGTTYYYCEVTNSWGCKATTAVSGAIKVYSAAIISSQPVAADYCVNASAQATLLSVTATTNAPGSLTYRWFSNTTNSNSGGTLIGSATSATYRPAITAAGATYYYVEVGNGGPVGCATTTSNATLINVFSTPTISQIVSSNYCKDAAANSISITASNGGVGTLTYQWYENTTASTSNGTMINGANSATYTPSTSTVGTKHYYVVVTNGGPTSTCNTITSGIATINIFAPPTINAHPVSATYCKDNTVTALTVGGAATGGLGTLSYQWFSNTTNTNSGGATITNTTATYTPLSTIPGTYYYYVEVRNGATGGATACNTTPSNVATITIHPLPVSTSTFATESLCISSTATSMTASATTTTGTIATYQWYKNSTNNYTGATQIANETNATFTPPTTTTGTSYYFCEITNSWGCSTRTAISGAINVYAAPVITAQPTGATYCQNVSATALSVSATAGGLGTPTYQWYSNTINSNSGGTLLTGATSATYTPSTSTVGTTYYYVVINNGGGTAGCSLLSSNAVAIVVNDLPVINAFALGTQTLCLNATPSNLSVTASTATGTISATGYQWYSNTTNSTSGASIIAAANTNTYTPPTNVAGNKYYFAVITNSFNCTTTTIVSGAINVNPLPTISSQPSQNIQTKCLNETFTALSVTATAGSGSISKYEWYSNTTNSTTGGILVATNNSNALTNSYTPSSSSAGVLYYYVIVYNTNGCQITSAISAPFTVNDLPSISVQPSNSNQTACLNTATTNLTVSASPGSGSISNYTWYRTNSLSGTPVWTTVATNTTSSTTNSHTPASTSVGTLYYYVIVTNSNGCIKASTASGSVTINPVAIINDQVDTYCSSTTFSRTLTTSGSITVPANTTFSWNAPSVTGGITGGAPGSAETTLNGTLVNPTNVPQTATYTVTPRTGTCDGATFTYTVTINPRASITVADLNACSGSPFEFQPVHGTNGNIIPTNTTYAWSAPLVTGGITGGASANSQTKFIGNLTNPNNTQKTATYTVTPTSPVGPCNGNNFTIVVNVNARPVIANKTQTICSGTAFSIRPENTGSDIVPANTTYSWTVQDNANILGESNGNTTGTTISQTLTNNSHLVQTVVYDVTPVSGDVGNCQGARFTITVTINPKPSISAKTVTACSNQLFTTLITNGVNSDIVPNGITYTWSSPIVTGNMTGGTAGNAATSVSGNLTNPTSVNQTATYTVIPSVPGSTTCTGPDFTVVATIKPKATIATKATTACSNDAFTFTLQDGAGSDIIPTGTTYTWSSVPTVTGGLTGGATGSAQAVVGGTLSNPSNSSQTATYNVTANSDGCSSTPFSATATIYAKPFINTQNVSSCSGSAFSVPLSNGGGNILPNATTYTWTVAQNSNVTGASNVNVATSPITQTLTNITNTDQIVTYTVTPISGIEGNCVGLPFTVNVTVKPKPSVTPQTESICSGNNFTNLPTNGNGNIIPTGTTFTWNTTPTSNPIGAVSGGSAQTSPQTRVEQLLTNNTNAPATLTYAVTPSANGCAGSSYQLIVNVNPKPAITAMSATICSSETFTLTPANGTNGIVPANTTYTWTVIDNPNVTGESDVITSRNNISQTLVNTSNIPQTVSYRVSPVSGEAGACPGATFTVSVLVNPQPSITAAQAQTVCSGTPFNIAPANLIDGIVPSTTRYTWANPVDNPVGSITGQSAQLVATTSVGQSLNNITNAPATISYTVTPIAGSCTGANFTAVITVNPKPDITAQARTICSEETFTVTPVNSVDGIVPNNTTYTWNIPVSNPPGAVTGWATQTTAANLISQQLTNTTNAAATLTYNVFPKSGAAGNCIGNPFNVVVSVNAKPVIGNQTRDICSGSAFNVALTNGGSTIIPANTTYKWFVSTNNSNITGQSNVNIYQTSISQTLTNNTNVAQQITYTVTPKSGAIGQCVGATFLVTVTVNPKPVIATQTQTICSNATFSITPENGGNLIVPASTTYTWNTAPTSNPLGAISGGTAQISAVSNISQLLTNNSNSQGLLTYIVTPTAGTAGRCVGAPFNVEITVSPKPILTSTLTPAAICNATNFSYNPISPTDGVSWVWTRNTIAGISNTAGTGTGVINETLINTTPNRITVPYSFALTTYGCPNTQTVNVIVNPTPQLTSLLINPAQCSGTPFYYNPNSATTGTTYAWTRANIAGISNPATTGTGAISETLINTSPNPIVVNYLYTLTANGCTNQQSISVTIDPLPIANFSIDGLRADCGPTTRRLINNSSVNSNPLTNGTFTWGIDILRNGGAVPVYSLINTNYTTQVNYTFTNTGIRDSLYPITLTAKSPNGCLNTYRDTITVHPDARIDLTIGTTAACAPFNAINSLNVVNKTDPSPDPTINLFSSYKWTIRDKRGNILSNTVSPTPPNYTITNADDTLLIALKVNSLYGCRPDSVNRIVYTYQNPIVNFTVAPQNSCTMLSTQAVNTSYIGPNRTTSTLRYAWYANGSLLSNAQVPGTFNLINNSNTRDTIYTIKLVVSETINSCKDSSSVGNLIVYPKPKAIFTIDKADEVCTTINGVNSSINNSSLFKNGTVPQYKWSVTYNNLYDTARAIIIDSTTAPFIAAKPNFKFRDAKGTVDTSYNINMMIYTVNGCIDTLTKSIKIRRRPNVDFTIPVEGCGIYIVNPTDNTINFPNDSLNRQWTVLPTGGLSLFNANANNPYVIFPVNNTANSIAYKVKQTVTVKGFGDCIDSLNRFITIHPKPTASFIVGKIDSCGPWTKTFRNTSDPKNGLGINAITSRWEVRRDNIVRLNTSAQNLTYTFTNTGVKDSVYTVRLFVSNPQGCLDTTAIQQITVHPNARAFFNTDTLGCAPFKIRDHIKVQDFPEANDIWRYEWRIYDRFGFLLANYDSSVLAPDYVIQNESDTVTLQLIAYSKWGCTQDIFSRQVITRPNSVKANVTADSTICSNLPLAFTNTSYYGNNNQTAGLIYDWYVNDSKVTNLNSPTFIFRNNSNVSDSILYVKLVTTFTGTGCNDSVTKKITIYPAPAANFTVTTKEICGNPVGFKNFVTESVVAKNNVYNTAWAVTNLTLNKPSGLQVLPTSTNKRFQLQFGDNPGNIDTIYAVKLTATSINGCKADTTTNISLYRRPNVKFAISNTLVCGEITLQLTDQTSNVPTAKVWSYTTPTGNPLLFFPSATATSPKVLVPPNITGNLVSYYIKQVATTVNGCVDSALVQLDAKALPTAVFSMSDTTSCIDSVTIRFKDQSIPRTPETITGWSWDFGDGITSNSQNPSHFYNKPGTYTISLVITNNEGCSSLPTRKRLVVYGSPRARFTMPKKVCQTDTIRFINNTVLGHGTTNFASEWNFGDGSSINTNANPSHVFTKPGIFIVSLKVKADSSCTTSTIYDTITVAGFPKAGFRHQFNCVNSPVNFIDTSIVGFADTLGAWRWTFDNGSFSSQPSPTQRFSSLRTYNVKLLVSGLACPNLKDSVTYPLLIDAPIASFNMSDTVSCMDTIQIKFTDLSTTYAPTTIRNWNWNFGDGNSSTLQSPTHVFRKPGKYFITLTVTNNEGCTSLPLIKQLIVYGSPKAAFVMPKQICLTDSIPFVNTSTLGYGSTKFISYTWDFGDGIPLNYTANPTHRFKFAGKFGVRLTVRADSSCMTSTFVDSVTVIGYPKAKFGIENYCVETPIFFRDSSVAGYADRLGSWKWNFGDNSFSSATNPVHIYKRTGTFPVQLVVSGNLCPYLQDSITVPLKIIDRRRDSVYAIKYLQYNVAQSLCALPGGDKYTWSPSTDINPISSRCVTINVQHPKTIYKITIIDSAGCTINDRQEIWGFPGTDIFLPRAFTPASNNRDNTIFKPIYVGVTAIKYFKIYDRFGHEVFTTSDMSKYWDGTSNGVNQPMETYTWIIQGFDYNNKPVIRQGNVTLIRYQ
jgi:gliding motility-associated-like protein